MHVNVRDSYCYTVLLRTLSPTLYRSICWPCVDVYVCVYARDMRVSLFTSLHKILSTVRWSTHRITTVDINLCLVKSILMTPSMQTMAIWNKNGRKIKGNNISNYFLIVRQPLDQFLWMWREKNGNKNIATYQKLICPAGSMRTWDNHVHRNGAGKCVFGYAMKLSRESFCHIHHS